MTVTAADVAEFVLQQKGSMSAMKLQKLVYYSQAWSLVWDDVPLFSDQIQAWANGPVVLSLFRFHKGKFKVSPGDFPSGDPSRLNADQRETVQVVLSSYGAMTAGQLSELTHAEGPWRKARMNVDDGEPSRAIITPTSMRKYYTELSQSKGAVHDVSQINFPAWAR